MSESSSTLAIPEPYIPEPSVPVSPPAHAPRRVVTLTCSNTEIVCALGAEDRLVAVDDHSDFPVAVVDGLPRVGPDLGIDVDKVKALEPDLVLASMTVPGHEKVLARLEDAGLPFWYSRPQSLEDVYRDIDAVSVLLGIPEQGQETVRSMREEMAEARSSVIETAGRRPKIAVQWWPKPVIVPGRLSWVHDLIEAAGGENLIGDEAVESRPLTDEEVRDLAPDAIVLSWCGVEEKKYRPDVVYGNALWQDVPAIRERRVLTITEAFLGRPSPRLLDGFRALKRVVEQCLATEQRSATEQRLATETSSG